VNGSMAGGWWMQRCIKFITCTRLSANIQL